MRETLRKLGMTEIEISIYLFLLKQGEAKATTIAKELGIHRTNVYRILENMHLNSFVSEVTIDGIKIYKPLPPTQLKQTVIDNISAIDAILPQLNKIYTETEEQLKIEVLKGNNAFKLIQNEMLEEKSPYTVYGTLTKYLPKELETFIDIWTKRAEQLKIKGKILCSQEDDFAKSKLEKIKKLPIELLSDITTITYADKTAIIIWSNQINIIKIINKPLTESLERNFNHLWETL